MCERKKEEDDDDEEEEKVRGESERKRVGFFCPSRRERWKEIEKVRKDDIYIYIYIEKERERERKEKEKEVESDDDFPFDGPQDALSSFGTPGFLEEHFEVQIGEEEEEEEKRLEE